MVAADLLQLLMPHPHADPHAHHHAHALPTPSLPSISYSIQCLFWSLYDGCVIKKWIAN